MCWSLIANNYKSNVLFYDSDIMEITNSSDKVFSMIRVVMMMMIIIIIIIYYYYRMIPLLC